MIKNEDNIFGDHLELYFYYINKEQKLVVMYLELIYNRIKTAKWKVAEVPKIAYIGTETGRKDCLCKEKASKKDGLCRL